jgi:hypothetical protein
MADTQQITVRVDARMIERADSLLNLVAEETGRGAVRADVWREALIRGLRELERLRDKRAR